MSPLSESNQITESDQKLFSDSLKSSKSDPIKHTEKQALSALWRFRACKISDGEYKTVIGLKPDDQKHFLTEGAIHTFRAGSIRDWHIRCFMPEHKPDAFNPGWSAALESAKRINSTPVVLVAGDLMSDHIPGFIIQTPEEAEQLNIQSVLLPQPAGVPEGTQVLIVNGNKTGKHESAQLQVMCDGTSRKKLIEKDIWLQCTEGVVLEVGRDAKGDVCWKVAARRKYVSARLETNPLVRNSGGVRCGDDGLTQSQDYDGEYHLPLTTTQNILTRKLANQNIKWTCCANEQELTDYLTALKHESGGQRKCRNAVTVGHIVLENPASNHSVAIRISVKQGQVIGYCHDAMGWENQDPEQIRDILATGLRKAFPKATLAICAPEERFQIDYYSCGVLAIKAMRFFAKYPDKMDALIEGVKGGANGNIGLYSIKISRLPVGLLKMCQEPEKLFEDQFLAPIDPKKPDSQSLGQYLLKYRRDTPGASETSNHPYFHGAALAKRYAYFAEQSGDDHQFMEVDPIEVVTTDTSDTEPEKASSGKLQATAVRKRGRAQQRRAGGPYSVKAKAPHKAHPDMTVVEFLIMQASTPGNPNVIWVNEDTCRIFDQTQILQEWQATGGTASTTDNFSRSLRSHYRKELQICTERNVYKFNRDYGKVKLWKDRYNQPLPAEVLTDDDEPVECDHLDKESGPQKSYLIGKEIIGQNFGSAVEFLFYVVSSSQHDKIAQWTGNDGEFKIHDKAQLLELYNQGNTKPARNYHSMMCSVGNRCTTNMISRFSGRRGCYKFNMSCYEVKYWQKNIQKKTDKSLAMDVVEPVLGTKEKPSTSGI